ncbi:MAG: aquaporin [Chloroflexota bacterium]
MNPRALVVEFIGTFFLVFVVGMMVIGASAATAPFAGLAIGIVLAVMIFAGGHISGGHYNPAVTLGVLIRGKIAPPEAVAYWVVQIVAAVVAFAAVTIMLPGKMPASAIVANLDTVPALLGEFLFTFALVYVVLNVATAKGTEGNSFYGLAIGFTVLAGAYAVGGISGGAFNPAVAIGATLMKIFDLPNIWIYLLADLVGGAAAAVTFKYLHPGE